MSSYNDVPPLGRATFTIAEAARILGVSRGTAYGLARSGALPVLRLGGRRIVVARASLASMLEGNAHEPSA